MRRPAVELANLDAEQNFAIATLCKQKESLNAWLKYLNIKSIHMPGEVSKYRKRVADINNAIKILEEELLPQSLEKNRRSRSSKQTKPATKNEISNTSSIQPSIDNTKLPQPADMVAANSSEGSFTDKSMTQTFK